MNSQKIRNSIRNFTAIIAIIFGAITIIAGSRVLFGFSEPSYVVFYPLLIFNSIMGIIYLYAGFLIWKYHAKGEKTSLIISLANLTILGIIILLHQLDYEIAQESIVAMSFRTIVWLVIYGILKYLKR